MNFRINYCKVTGVKHPRILVNGWIDSSIDELELYCRNKIIWKEKYFSTGIKAHAFEIAIDIPKSFSLDLIAISGKKRKRLVKIPVNIGIRLLNSKKTSWLRRNKKKASQDVPIKSKPNEKTYNPLVDVEYQQWLMNRKEESISDFVLKYQPLISIVIPVYNVEGKYLAQCIDSVLEQTYQKFEICLADDCSSNQETIDTLKRYEKKDSRIKICYRQKNGHISLATNSALAMAEGEYIGLVDNDDVLDKTALAEVVKVLNEDKSLDFIYSDEDKLDYNGKRVDPHFKPDFVFDNFLSSNYICHFSVIRRKYMEEIGGFREGYEGAQDYDLFLRIIKKTNRIHHIPKVLYHWRKIPGSTAVIIDSKNYAVDAGLRALKDFFMDGEIQVKVQCIAGTVYNVSYPFYEETMVDIVIVSDDLEKIKKTIDMWLVQLNYLNYRFVIISNNKIISQKLGEYQNIVDIHVVRKITEFNQYAYNCESNHFLFWSVENTIDNPEWLRVLVSYANNLHIGAVGSNVLNEETSEFASGYVVVNKHKAIPVRYDYIAIGYSPTNRCIVGKTTYLVNRQHFVEVGGFDTSLDLNAMHYDLQIKLHNMYKRNIVIPQIYYMQKQDIGWEEYLPEMESMSEFERDPCYNPNLSEIIAYKL